MRRQISSVMRRLARSRAFCVRVAFMGLRRKTGQSGEPMARMVAETRANGMWRGPKPPELSGLTYCEGKVMNMARIYVSVKRVFLNRSNLAQTKASEAPTYHQKNVVAFPQRTWTRFCSRWAFFVATSTRCARYKSSVGSNRLYCTIRL